MVEGQVQSLQPTATYRPVVVAPTFNNARTLQLVLERIDALGLGLDVLVVDDGSTDRTPEILRGWNWSPGHLLITHPVNRGKAAALLNAFEHVIKLGYSHAITIDTDGQLEPEQIPRLLELSRRHPLSLILGCRDESKADYPTRSRIGRRVSNLLVKWESGAVVEDSQCGFRVYPLELIANLRLRWGRYALETEVLARCAWAGIDLQQIEVTCAYEIPQGRVSHFRPWRDSFAAVGMHAMLMTRSLNPWPIERLGDKPTGTIWRRFIQWISPLRAWREVRDNPKQRKRFAAGLATGVFIANLPLYGIQSALSLLTARWFKLSPLSVLAGSHIATPPIGPLLVAMAIFVGHLLLQRELPDLNDFNPQVIGYFGLIRSVLLEWVLGGILCGAVLAVATYLIAMLFIRMVTHSPQLPADQLATPTPASL